MELIKGTCFFCRSPKVIKPAESQEAFNMICILLSKEILKHNEFNKVKSALKICPICYHKLIILKRTDDNIQPNVDNGRNNSCLLCKSKKNLVQIKNWTNFNLILEDLAFLKKSDCVTCSDCLFYLHTKTEIRTKLFVKYPQLKNSKENKRKFKLKFTPNMKLQSTPISAKKRGARIRPLRVVNISSIIDLTTDTINFDSLKKLKPLKKYKSFRNLKVVKADSKFLNQIPFVLINISNVHGNSLDEEATMNEKEVFRDEAKRKPGLKTASESSKVNLKKDLQTLGIVKDLVVNVSRMRIEKYLSNYEPDPDIQNLIDKFNILQPLNEEEKSGNNTSNITDSEDSFVEEPELSFDTKNKRKSVSFAEEKNVEIEYFDDISNLKSRNENLDGNSVEVARRKQNKGILKREENVEQTVASDNEECSETEGKQELLNSSTYKENKEISIDSETSPDPAKEKKLRKSRNTVTENNDDEQDIGNAEEFSDSSVEPVDGGSVDQGENDESRPKTKKKRPKPLSKKKKHSASVKAVSDDSIDIKNSDDNSEEIENESPIDSQRMSDKSKSENEEPVSKETVDEENSPLVTEQIIHKETLEDKTTKDNKLKRRMSSADTSETVEEIDCEAGNASVNEDEPVVKKPKKNKPMPLSRKKRREKAENMGDDANLEKSSTSDVENSKETVEKVKRQKPGPLSKKKKKIGDEPKVIENENNSKVGLDSEDKNIDDSNEKDIITIDDSNEKEILTDMEDTVSKNETQTDSESSKTEPIVEQESVNESESSGDITKEEISTSLEKNGPDSVLSDEDEVHSSNLISEENSVIEKDKDLLELCDDVLNKDTVEDNEKNNEIDNSLGTTDDTAKPTSMSDSVTHLVNKYLISPDNDSFINTPEKDDSLEQPTNRSFDKASDEELTAGNNSDKSLNKKMDCIDTDSFSEYEKGEELGMSEVDNENINSILSHILPPELSESTFDTINEKDENDLCDDSQDSHCNVKRKTTDDELDVSKEKKKKKVTFCDDVT